MPYGEIACDGAMFVLFVCRPYVWAGEGEIPTFRGMFSPRTLFRDTWGWWRECLGNSQLVWESKDPPFPPYCAFLPGRSQMVFPDTRPTCVLGGQGVLGLASLLRAASLAPHEDPYNTLEVSPFFR